METGIGASTFEQKSLGKCSGFSGLQYMLGHMTGFHKMVNNIICHYLLAVFFSDSTELSTYIYIPI